MVDDEFDMQDMLGAVRTVHGVCPECHEETLMVAIVTDYYKCVTCGEETKQYINGSIKYLRLTKEDHEWLRKQKALASTTTSNGKK
jgi:tRNA splicing endonuclease